MWYAKKPLPGAAPSPEFSFSRVPDPEITVAADSERLNESVPFPDPAPKTSKGTPARSVDLQALMTPTVEEPESTPENEPDQLQETSEPAKTAALPAEEQGALVGGSVTANLGFWSAGPYLLVSQWSTEASDKLQDTLATNILQALGQTEINDRQNLQWPVFRSPRIPGNSAKDFQSVLNRLVSSHTGKSIILLGVLGDESEERRSDLLRALLSETALDFEHSLAALSANPAHKRGLWNALKARFSG
ncbi:hypothetical protein [Marinobacter sp. CHS3-4]|uniref:hypothetical protein n=1 Tax=Marinobacter sp. CHS3-4 TaxID=3045174 RepID=UPI0024B5E47A|nr:hypothetical protein [Marinobacter sp. CHS3-4]MDI9246287.1 hypothetical protein [Marinobacter sp. CHS3-4]